MKPFSIPLSLNVGKQSGIIGFAKDHNTVKLQRLT